MFDRASPGVQEVWNLPDRKWFETSPCSPTVVRQNSVDQPFGSGTHLAHETLAENESVRCSGADAIDQQISGH
jgi:hypothetical protein